MVTKWALEITKVVYKTILCLSKGGLQQAIGVRSMVMG